MLEREIAGTLLNRGKNAQRTLGSKQVLPKVERQKSCIIGRLAGNFINILVAKTVTAQVKI